MCGGGKGRTREEGWLSTPSPHLLPPSSPPPPPPLLPATLTRLTHVLGGVVSLSLETSSAFFVFSFPPHCPAPLPPFSSFPLRLRSVTQIPLFRRAKLCCKNSVFVCVRKTTHTLKAKKNHTHTHTHTHKANQKKKNERNKPDNRKKNSLTAQHGSLRRRLTLLVHRRAHVQIYTAASPSLSFDVE